MCINRSVVKINIILKILDITSLRHTHTYIYIYIFSSFSFSFFYKCGFRISALHPNLSFSHYVSAQKWIKCNKVFQIDQIGAKWTKQNQSGPKRT